MINIHLDIGPELKTVDGSQTTLHYVYQYKSIRKSIIFVELSH